MEVTTNQPGTSSFENFEDEGRGAKIKQKLGAARRRIKQIDLRQTVIDHPFAAVGIGLAAGALVGLIRPKPEPGRITSALMSVAGMLTYRLIKDAAVAQIGQAARSYIKDQLGNRDERQPAASAPF